MSGPRTQTSAGQKTPRRLTRAQAATATAVMKLESISTAVTMPPVGNPGAREETPELENPPPRIAKVKALRNKGLTCFFGNSMEGSDASTQVQARARRAGLERLNRVATTSQGDHDEAVPSKKARTKVIQGARSQRKSDQSAARTTGHPGARTTTTRTVLQDSPADEVNSGDEEPSDVDKPQDDGDESESGDDPVLDDELEAYLLRSASNTPCPTTSTTLQGPSFTLRTMTMEEDELEEEIGADKVEAGRELATVGSSPKRRLSSGPLSWPIEQELDRVGTHCGLKFYDPHILLHADAYLAARKPGHQ
ncbi:hypothetical protein GSI_04096 [Ganoderma sinense ZZ0214-1]|uniref:Uncharacterized protein n=1 Tax=Ganoderma sinense ZZ0214-1 TaxID=1077348 RepID=A0A2G8SI84_9APHY|nr:hypothetical protein GSI_04096 [Ganoderma sinense ZZ0214-1]